MMNFTDKNRLVCEKCLFVSVAFLRCLNLPPFSYLQFQPSLLFLPFQLIPLPFIVRLFRDRLSCNSKFMSFFFRSQALLSSTLVPRKKALLLNVKKNLNLSIMQKPNDFELQLKVFRCSLWV